MKKSRLALSISIALMAVTCCSDSVFAGEPAAPAADDAASAAPAAQDSSPTAQTNPSAQTGKPAGAAQLEGIQVNGYAGSLAKSVADKRNAEGISDTISAEDVGKLPDSNMAESLQRITGVQITRSNGEGQYVSLDGLDPKFTSVLFNGRELPSTPGQNSSATNTRSFDFTTLNSDFVSSLEAIKSSRADLPEGGLAGTINVHTIQPLDYGKERFVATAEGVYDDNAKGGAEPHFSALYTNTFFDHTLGWVIGADYGLRRLDVQRYDGYGMQPTTPGAGSPPAPDLNNGKPYNLPNATELAENTGERTRKSFMSELQYRPNENLEVRLDGLYSRFKNNTYLPINSLREVDPTGTTVPTGVVDANNNVVYYNNSGGIDNRNNARTNLEIDTLKSAGLGATLSLGDWKVDGEASYSGAKQLYTDYSLEVIGRASGFYDLRSNPSGIPTIGFNSNYDPMNPNNFNAIGFNGNIDQPTNNIIRNAQLTASRDLNFGWLHDVQFGVDYKNQQYSTGSNSLSVSAQQIATALGIPYNPALENGSFNAAPWMQVYGGSNFLSDYGGKSTFPKTWLAANPYAFLNTISLQNLEKLSPITQNPLAVSTLREKTSSGFAKLDFVSPDSLWSGNFGLRFVSTKQTSAGFVPDLNNITFNQGGAVTTAPTVPKSEGRTYWEILPSLSLNYNITDDLIARVSGARVMQRADLSVLAPTTAVNANVRQISEGNPDVAPYLANQFNASLEWYFNDKSLLSFAAFYKDVQNFIVNTQHTATYNVTQDPGGEIVPTTFVVSQKNNGASVKLKGFELGYQQPFTFLPGWFQSFGALANYTYIHAGTVVETQGAAPVPVSGVSKNTYNVGFYYDDSVFSARVLYNYRSSYVSDPYLYFGDGAYVKGYGQLDLSSSYNFNKHISVTFDVQNIMNKPHITVDSYGFNELYELDGRRATLGLHASF